MLHVSGTDGEAGLRFDGRVYLSGFTGNKLHSNWGPEIKVGDSEQGSWAASPACTDAAHLAKCGWDFTPLSDACDDTANQIYCYATIGSTETDDVGISHGAVHVDARYVHWRNMSPASAREMTDISSPMVEWMPPCTPVATCP